MAKNIIGGIITWIIISCAVAVGGWLLSLPLSNVIFFVIISFPLIMIGIYYTLKILNLTNRWTGKYIPVAHVEFYEYREGGGGLSTRRPLKDTLWNADAVWALWMTGANVYSSDAYKADSLRKGRVILPTPDLNSASIAYLSKAFERKPQELVTDILALSRVLKNEGGQVKWFDHQLSPNTLTIINPNSNNGWVQVEIVMNHIDVGNRPSIIVPAISYPRFYQSIMDSYSKIWDNARVPTTQELQ